MAEFNPAVPEAPEPNYLRYSRPSNYAEPNKGPGEAFKAIGETVSQGLKTADSLVKSGIYSGVSRQAQEDSDQYIHGQLEPEYNRLYGTNLGNQSSLIPQDAQAQATPQEIKNLPDRVAAQQAFKAKGGFVPTMYQGQMDTLAKDYRSRFPMFSNYIDRTISEATGGVQANKYASNLLSGINAAYAKADKQKNEDAKFVDKALEMGLVDNNYYNKWRSGEQSADRAREMLSIDGQQKNNHEIRMRQLDEYKVGDEVARIKGRRVVEGAADDLFTKYTQISQNAHGIYSGLDFNNKQRSISEGQTEPLSEQEKLGREQAFSMQADRYRSELSATVAKAKPYLNEGEADKIINDRVQRLRDWNAMSQSKEYSAEPFSIANHEKAKMGDINNRLDLSPLGTYMDARKVLDQRGDPDMKRWVEKNSFDPNMQGEITAFMHDRMTKAAISNKDSPAPSIHKDLMDLDKNGGSGDAKQNLLGVHNLISGKVSPETAHNLVNYAFSGDNPNVFRDIEVDSRDSKGDVKKGRYSVYEDYSSPKMVSTIKNLSPGDFNTYKQGMTTAYSSSLFGHEINQLSNIQHEGLKLSYDSDNGHFTVHADRSDLSLTNQRNRIAVQNAQTIMDRLNRGTDGLVNVLKGDGTDHNAYLLSLFKSGSGLDLSQVQGIPQKMRDAVMSSGKQSMNEGQGQVEPSKMANTSEASVMSDATPDAVKPGQQYAMHAPVNPALPKIFGQGEAGGGGIGFPSKAPAPVKGVAPEGVFDSSKLGREMPAELPKEPAPPKVEPNKVWDLDKTQKKLDRTLKQAGEAAKTHTEAVESSYRKAEENIFAREAPAENVIGRFKDHPREEEILNNKIDSLKLQEKNVGPKGLVGKNARMGIKLIQARLKEINQNRVGTEMEKDIKDTVDKEFK